MNNIRDKVVVITGASSGIGRGTALEVARQQGTVVLAARNGKALKQVGRECETAGGRVMISALDVTDLGSMKKLARKAVQEFGRIDVWVNNAAVSLFARFEETPPEVYERVIETNLFGYMNGARAALPYFREQGEGVLINVSSMIGKAGAPYVSAYSTSKFAINGWSESLRMELQDVPDIHVCTVLPASIDTPIFQHAGNYTGRAVKPLPPVYSPLMVVDAIVRCMVKPRREISVGKAGAMMSAMRTLAPAMAEKMIARQVDQEHFKDEPEERTDGILFDPEHGPYSVDGAWGGQETGSAGRILGGVAALAGIGAAAYLWTQRGDGTPVKKRAKKAIPKAKRAVAKNIPERLGKIRNVLPFG